MAGNKRYSYIRKKLAKGTAECILAAVGEAVLMAAALAAATYFAGNGPLVLGALAFFSVVLGFYAVWLSICAVRQTDRNSLPGKAAGIASFILLIGWAFILVIGLTA